MPGGEQTGNVATDVRASDVEDAESANGSPPPALVKGFWTIVLLVKLGVIVVGGGAILLVLTEHHLVGLGLIAVGVLVFVRIALTFRRVKTRHVTGER